MTSKKYDTRSAVNGVSQILRWRSFCSLEYIIHMKEGILALSLDPLMDCNKIHSDEYIDLSASFDVAVISLCVQLIKLMSQRKFRAGGAALLSNECSQRAKS